MLCPMYRPCPVFELSHNLSCCLAIVVIGSVVVMIPPLCLGQGKSATEGRGSKSRDFPIFSPIIVFTFIPSPLTYVSEVAGDGYHMVIATNICVKRIARQLVWKKVNGGNVTAVSRCAVGWSVVFLHGQVFCVCWRRLQGLEVLIIRVCCKVGTRDFVLVSSGVLKLSLRYN
jgi:hypothetical protein